MTPPTGRPEGDDQILKVDTMGRVRTPRDRREALLDRFENSGMSSSAFAEHHGIKYTTFATWVQQRRKRGSGKGFDPKAAGKNAGQALSLARVVLDEGGTGAVGPLVVALPGGTRLNITDSRGARLAAELLGALGARG